ncbi:MAG: MltA domain-containing protein [Candidatus Moduliflexus flocculans]|nr:MltA domain-containing protein [Candidatus Moduliflexus flocculans]
MTYTTLLSYASAMKIKTILIGVILVIAFLALAGCQKRSAVLIDYQEPPKDYSRALPPGELALRKITDPNQIPDYTRAFSDMDGLAEAIERSLNYMAKPSSKAFYPYGDITHEHAVISLQELKKLVTSGLSPKQMNEVLREKFDTYISVGCDDQGTVLFTGYYTPIFNGSLTSTDRFKYPLYKSPADLVKGPDGTILGRKGPDGKIQQYPSREEIQNSNILAGNELVWLSDPFEVYIVHVQGSAKIRMPNGKIESVGYAAHNGWEYKSIVPKMIADGKLSQKNINLKAMIGYFMVHRDEVDEYINQNPRFVFFRSEEGEPRGSLNEPVTPFRTIATDKSIYPRAMFSFVSVNLDRPVGFALDQDTGGAIRAAGRCDVYMGVGDRAGELAGGTYREGRLYYLFIKPDSDQMAGKSGQGDTKLKSK